MKAFLTGLVLLLPIVPFANADTFSFSTGSSDGRMAVLSRPANGGKIATEAADDFTLASPTTITSATFVGLLTGPVSNISAVSVEIYNVFPLSSDTTRTPVVPTRTNSPSDNAVSLRDSGLGTLTFSTSVLDANFTALNSVQPGGIHAAPNQTTGGDGPLNGTEVEFTVTFTTPLVLSADQYFFVPQVDLGSGAGSDFYWLSAASPTAPDLQMWTRDANLDPDWLRVGTDIVSRTTFNGTFSLTGQTLTTSPVPEPATLALLITGVSAAITRRARSRR